MNEDIQAFIEGSKKLIDIFSYWPSFHDAEVLELTFWRGDESRRLDGMCFQS